MASHPASSQLRMESVLDTGQIIRFGFGRSHLFVNLPYPLHLKFTLNGRNHFNPLGIRGPIK